MNAQQLDDEIGRLKNTVLAVSGVVASLTSGRVKKAIADSGDVADLKAAEKALRVAQLRLAALIAELE